MRRVVLVAIALAGLALSAGAAVLIHDALTRPKVDFDHFRQALP